MRNNYMSRVGKRAQSAMIMRNEYSKQFGIQYYLIVEGTSDEKFFENIVNCRKCKVINLGCKEAVKAFINARNQGHKKGYLGIVDADFEHITQYEDKVDNVILTDVHDIEMLILSSQPDMRRIYSEMTENIIVIEYEKKHSKTFLQSVLEAAYEIGLLKLVIKRKKYNISMKELPYVDFLNDNFDVDVDKIIDRVKGRNYTFYEIKSEFEKAKSEKYDQYQVCCGHDATNILAVSFMANERGGLEYGKQNNVTREKIEELLRVVYNLSHFSKTKMYKEIVEWEKANNIEILDKTVFSVAS